MHWKVWTLLCTLAWTAWGVAVKLALRKMGWQQLEILSAISALIIMNLLAPSAFNMKFDTRIASGLLAGSLGAAGAILFFIAVSSGPVSVVIPVTSLYVVGVAIFGLIFFNEPLTVRKALGIVLAAGSIILLSSEH